MATQATCTQSNCPPAACRNWFRSVQGLQRRFAISDLTLTAHPSENSKGAFLWRLQIFAASTVWPAVRSGLGHSTQTPLPWTWLATCVSTEADRDAFNMWLIWRCIGTVPGLPDHCGACFSRQSPSADHLVHCPFVVACWHAHGRTDSVGNLFASPECPAQLQVQLAVTAHVLRCCRQYM